MSQTEQSNDHLKPSKHRRTETRTILATIVAFGLITSLTGGETAADCVFKAAHNGSAGHPFDDRYVKFKEVIEEITDGKVEVQIFPAEQLGSEEQVNEMIQLGTAELNITASTGVSNCVQEVELFNPPFIFRDLDHMYRVLDGPVGERIADAIE